MIHQLAAAFYEAQAGEFIMEAEELLKLRKIITKVYVQRTGKLHIAYSKQPQKSYLLQWFIEIILITVGSVISSWFQMSSPTDHVL